MSDLKNFLRDIGYFGVGAAAAIIEVGGKAVKCLVRKGEKVLRENQDTVDEIKAKTKEAGEKIKEAWEDLSAKPEPTVEEPTEVEVPEVEIPEAEVPEGEVPVTPDVIYRTNEPAPVEEIIEEAAEEIVADAEDESKPEETING